MTHLDDKRLRLLAFIEQDPGCTPRKASMETGMHHATVRRVLECLVQEGRVFVAKRHGRIHLVIHRPGIETHWPQVVALRDEAASWIHARLRRNGPRHQRQLQQEAQREKSLGRCLVQRRLMLLESVNLVQRISSNSSRKFVVYRAIVPPTLVQDLLERSSLPLETASMPSLSGLAGLSTDPNQLAAATAREPESPAFSQEISTLDGIGFHAKQMCYKNEPKHGGF